MDPLAISLALLDDLPALAAIELAAARLFAPDDVPPEMARTPLPISTLERASARGRLWVARLGQVRAGFLAADLLDGAPFVVELDVLPALHRRGIGTALLGAAAGWARTHPARALTLTTFRHLPFNAPFYARRGFVEVPAPAQGPELRARLAEEARWGLDPAKRVAMRLTLAPATDARPARDLP